MKSSLKVYVSEIEDTKRMEKSVVRWKDKVKKYMHAWESFLIEGEGLNKQGESVWIDRGRGSSAVAFPFKGNFQR